jgi:dienelactone hydrolase
VQFRAVAVPQRGGGTLEGALFAPDPALQTGPCPVVSMLPGGGAPLTSVEWAARRLAGSGYVVLVTRPAAGGSASSYHLAAVSGIDFLASEANPVRGRSDTAAVGVAGWSLGARALTRTQAEDPRVDALVAWDNLAVSDAGDEGSPACGNVPGTVYAPRVPALGQASETCADKGADAKKTAFLAWRAREVPAMQVVFAGATHFLWSAAGPERDHALSHHYTRAWLDLWLKGDAEARQRLLARGVSGEPLERLLSARFRSAVYLPGADCADLRAGCT